MNTISRFLVTTTIATMLASSVYANSSGWSIGVLANGGDFDTTGHEFEGTGSTETTATTISENVAYPAIFTEVTGVSSGGIFGLTVGVEYTPGGDTIGAKSRTDTTTDALEASQDDGTYDAKAEVEDLITAYIEPTIMFNDNFGIYAKAGMTRVKVNTLESIAVGADSASYGDVNIWGTSYGAGFKAWHSSGLFMKVEAIQTDYADFTLSTTTGNQNAVEVTNMEQEAVRAAIGYNF